jgi:hypothetical protein
VDPVDAPSGVDVADPPLGAEPVASCWLRWKAAGETDESDEAAMLSVGVQESRSSTQCGAVAGGCTSVNGTVF